MQVDTQAYRGRTSKEARAMGKMGTKSHIYCEPWPARDREKSISGVRGRGAEIGPLVRRFFLGVCRGKDCAAEGPKTVQAWRKRLKRV